MLALVTLPIAAYVAGTLSATPEDHAPRSPVILRDAEPTESPSPSEKARRDDADVQPRDDDEDGPSDDGAVKVVTPSPTRVGDDGADDGTAGGGDDNDDGPDGGGERDDDDRTDGGDD